MKSRILFLRN